MEKEKYASAIYSILVRLNYCESNRLIYKRLTEVCGIDKDYVDVFNKSRKFFSMMVYNITNQIVAELARVYDNHKDAFSLPHIIEFYKQHKNLILKWSIHEELTEEIVNQTISSADQFLSNISESINKLKKIRNKSIAHIDIKYISNTNTLYEGFYWGDIEDLINVAAGICIGMLFTITGKKYKIQPNACDDVDMLVLAAHKGFNA